jgi:hypothetical protein
MSPTDFRTRLHALGHTLRSFAAAVDMNVTTVGYWGQERPGAGLQPFPAWVGLLLTAWEALAAQHGPEAAE